jgi:hypothetical protein
MLSMDALALLGLTDGAGVDAQQVSRWADAGDVFDTAEGWFVGTGVALRPSVRGFVVVDLARFR